jgi:putative DNA methylase
MDKKVAKSKVVPFSLKNAPSLIERVWPAQKISVEAQKERKSGPGQTLTALGSYWKGRKPLVLVNACVLGALLPATEDQAGDLELFEMLMGMADEQVGDRLKAPLSVKEILEYGTPAQIAGLIEETESGDRTVLKLRPLPKEDRLSAMGRVIARAPYADRIQYLLRPEEVETSILIDSRVKKANGRLGTSATSLAELVEQLGVMRFGHTPVVADTFCGGGSIPFAAARLGCDTFASDLNPIAAMLTWAAMNIVGGDAADQEEFKTLQAKVLESVDKKIVKLAIEHDADGNRAKTFLYCLETRCPQTKWMVPVSTTWVVSGRRNVVARLKPDHKKKRFDIEIVTGVSDKEVAAASKGTLQGRDLVYEIDGETYRTPISTLRGDFREADGTPSNHLRLWERSDFKPRQGDVFQERLYCIHWATKDSLKKGRQETFLLR